MYCFSYISTKIVWRSHCYFLYTLCVFFLSQSVLNVTLLFFTSRNQKLLFFFFHFYERDKSCWLAMKFTAYRNKQEKIWIFNNLNLQCVIASPSLQKQNQKKVYLNRRYTKKRRHFSDWHQREQKCKCYKTAVVELHHQNQLKALQGTFNFFIQQVRKSRSPKK